MNKSNKTYKPSKANKVLKGIFTFLIAATLTLSAAACTPTKPDIPVNPNPPITDIDPNEKDKPTDPTQKDPNTNPPKPSDSEKENEEKQAFENAKTEYNTFVSKLFDGKNFTYQEGNVKTELADGKAKVTVDGEETYLVKDEDGKNYIYIKDDKGEWKKEEEKEITLEKIENDIKDRLTIENDNWTKLNNGTLIGKLGSEEISAEIDEENNTLTLEIGDKTITISDIEHTAIILPEIKETFDVNEHIDEILEKLYKPLRWIATNATSTQNKIKQVFNLYLTKSNNNLIDTLGVVLTKSIDQSEESFQYAEITFSGLNEDLTWESICKDDINYNLSKSTINNKLEVNIGLGKQKTYKEGIDILLDGLFDKNVLDNAAWYGWRYDSSPAEISNQIYLLENNKIYIKKIAVSSKGSSLDVVEAIKQNFKDKLEGDPKETWRTEEDKIIEIPSDSINIWAYHQNNIEQE